MRTLSRKIRRSSDPRAAIEVRRLKHKEQRDTVSASKTELARERARRQEALQARALKELQDAAYRLEGIIARPGNGATQARLPHSAFPQAVAACLSR